MSTRGTLMGAEVGKLASKISTIVDCATCGAGLAIEIVGARWGDPPFDWIENVRGHVCPVVKARGPSAEQRTEIEAVIATLGPVPEMPEPAPAPAGYVDRRLPSEREDEGEAWSE